MMVFFQSFIKSIPVNDRIPFFLPLEDSRALLMRSAEPSLLPYVQPFAVVEGLQEVTVYERLADGTLGY